MVNYFEMNFIRCTNIRQVSTLRISMQCCLATTKIFLKPEGILAEAFIIIIVEVCKISTTMLAMYKRTLVNSCCLFKRFMIKLRGKISIITTYARSGYKLSEIFFLPLVCSFSRYDQSKMSCRDHKRCTTIL